jgi:hypothetical protein
MRKAPTRTVLAPRLGLTLVHCNPEIGRRKANAENPYLR